MQRASETIGALAGALAKAQTELVNPEKSLVATIREEGPRGREQAFRNGGREQRPHATLRQEQATSARNSKQAPSKQPEASLGLHASAKLRERLISEIRRLSSTEHAAEWVRQSLPEKNRLRTSDAAQVEAVFEAKLAHLAASDITVAEGQEANSVEQSAAPASETGSEPDQSRDLRLRNPVDKSLLMVPELRRIRDRDHIRLVAGRPCLVCGRLPSDPHHLRFAQSRALSRKVSDEFTVPLCRGHHRELHRYGDEAAWWSRFGIDVLEIARALWLESHPLRATYTGVSENLGLAADQSLAAISPENNDELFSE